MGLNIFDIKEKTQYLSGNYVVMHILQDGHEAVVLADGPSTAWDAFEKTYGVAVDAGQQDGNIALLEGYAGDVLMTLRRQGAGNSQSELLVAKLTTEMDVERITEVWEEVLAKDGHAQGKEVSFEAYPKEQASILAEDKGFIDLVLSSHKRACELKAEGSMPGHETVADRTIRLMYEELLHPEKSHLIPAPDDSLDRAEEIIFDNYHEGLEALNQWVRLIDPDMADHFGDNVFVTLRDCLDAGISSQDTSKLEDWLTEGVVMRVNLTEDNLMSLENIRRVESTIFERDELVGALEEDRDEENPMVALKIPMIDFIQLEPGEKIKITGGVIGIFNSASGSGFVEPVTDEIEMKFSSKDWSSDNDAGRSIKNTFLLDPMSFRGEVLSFEREAMRHAMAKQFQEELKRLKEEGLLDLREGETFLSSSGFVEGVGYGGRDILSAVKQKIDELGVYVDASEVLTESEVSQLKQQIEPAVAKSADLSP